MIGLLRWKNGGVTSALAVRQRVKFFGTNNDQDRVIYVLIEKYFFPVSYSHA